MAIRHGKTEDVKSIMELIKEAVKDMDSKGILQWDEIYPSEDVIRQDIRNNSLYVFCDNEEIVQAIIVLNEFYDKEYEDLSWDYNNGKHLIIHRLCVHPEYQGRGIALKLITFAENFAEDNNYQSIRLDAFIPNKRACEMYDRLGYIKRGIIKFRMGNFYCYEKGICINQDK